MANTSDKNMSMNTSLGWGKETYNEFSYDFLFPLQQNITKISWKGQSQDYSMNQMEINL